MGSQLALGDSTSVALGAQYPTIHALETGRQRNKLPADFGVEKSTHASWQAPNDSEIPLTLKESAKQHTKNNVETVDWMKKHHSLASL